MSKFRIVNLIDKLFVTAAIFLIIYAWINFYVRDLWTTFILSLIFSFACVYLLFFIINKKQSKKELTKKKAEDLNEKFLAFKLSSKNEKINLMNKILSKNYETIVSKNSVKFKDGERSHTMLFCSHITKITNEDLLNILDEFDIDTDEVDIVCCEYQPNLNLKILKNLKINLINKESLYRDYFEKYNIYPDCSNINTKGLKLNFLDILKQFFLPQKAKQYFFCGLILIFSSIILPYKTYYIIFGSLLLVFSIVCKVLPKFKK